MVPLRTPVVVSALVLSAALGFRHTVTTNQSLMSEVKQVDSYGRVAEPMNKESCISQARDWKLEGGEEMCSAGKFIEVKKHVDCVKSAYGPLKDSEGLNWEKHPSLVKANNVCIQHGWSPEAAKRHTTCMLKSVPWLGKYGDALCDAGKYAQAESNAECIKKAHIPLYSSSKGLGWDLNAAVNKATIACKMHNWDPEASEKHTTCMLKSVTWLGKDGDALCDAGKYAEAESNAQCIKKAHIPLHSSKGLGWELNAAIKKATIACKMHGWNHDVSKAHTDCMVQTVPLLGKDGDALCDKCIGTPSCQKCVANSTHLPLSVCGDHVITPPIDDSKCVEEVLAALATSAPAHDSLSSRQRAEDICQKYNFDEQKALPFAKCIALKRKNSGDSLATLDVLDVVQCMERSWRETSDCHELFGPVDSQKGIVFIVDLSGSMGLKMPGSSQTRLGLMKAELAKVIKGLQEDQQFTILGFNSMVHPYREGLIQASAANIQMALAWLSKVHANGKTDIEKPLQQALSMSDVDAVHLLSDGEPTEGCKSAACLKLERNIPVHTTLLMPDTHSEEYTRASTFLRSISLTSGGEFRAPYP